MAGWDVGLGGFASGLSSGITAGSNLVSAISKKKEQDAQGAYLGVKTQQDQLALQQQQQQADDVKQERDLGNQGLSTYSQLVAAGKLPAGHFSDYYTKNIAPEIINNKIANGDTAGAAQFSNWVQSSQKQDLINNMGVTVMQTQHAAQTGDYAPLDANIKQIWNSLPTELTGGSQFQGLQISKGDDGSVKGISASYLGADGKVTKQNWNSTSDFIQSVQSWSHPAIAFELERQNGLLGPLVTAEAASQKRGAPAAAAQPAAAQSGAPVDDTTAFNAAPLASTAAPLVGGVSQPGAPMPRAGAASLSAPSAPVAPDATAASAAPAQSSVQPLAAAPSGTVPTDSAAGSASPFDQGDAIATALAPQNGPATGLPAAPRGAPTSPAPAMQMPPQGAAAASVPLPQPDPRQLAASAPPAGGSLAPPDASQPSPNVTIVPTRPVTQGAAAGIPAPSTQQPQAASPAGLTPEVHDAIVQGLASGEPETVALAKQVLAKYASPKYDMRNALDGSIVAVNQSNPNDFQVVYRANGGTSPETDAALTADAERYRQTGTLPPNMGRGQQGQVLAATIRNKAAEIETASGGDTATWPARWAQFKAQKGYSGTVDNIVAGIKNGSQPPDLAHLGQLSAPVSGELDKSGFNLAQAQVDWKRAQKQIASLNGPQMTRFVGLANSVTNTINEVNSLAGKMNLSGVPVLNRAEMQTYVQANGNSENGQLVTRYLTSVNTLKEEFASLAQGGYAPTESAWGLANTQINGNFGVKQLGASLGEVQRLINYRLHAFNDMDTQGPGAPNRYMGGAAPASAAVPAATQAPSQQSGQGAPAPGHYSFNPASGKLELMQ
jgi:hypothetical protein